jgi:hypothetical protein
MELFELDYTKLLMIFLFVVATIILFFGITFLKI